MSEEYWDIFVLLLMVYSVAYLNCYSCESPKIMQRISTDFYCISMHIHK